MSEDNIATSGISALMGNAVHGIFLVVACFFASSGIDYAMMSDAQLNKRLRKDPVGFFFWKVFTIVISVILGSLFAISMHSFLSNLDVLADRVLTSGDYFKYSFIGASIYLIVTLVVMGANKTNTSMGVFLGKNK